MIAIGCSAGTVTTFKYPDSADGIAKTAVEKYDANKDGKLDAGELAKCPSLLSLAKRINKIPLPANEIADRLKNPVEMKITMAAIPVKVMHRGAPLADAEVTASPEDFLAGYPILAGKTDANGMASLQREGAQVPYGFYKISVSKKNGGTETINAKYNSATILGLDALPDGLGRGGEMLFTLTE